MNVLVINGSPRRSGNTASLADAFANEAKKAGHNVTVKQIGNMDIRGCKNCDACRKTLNGDCVQKDDISPFDGHPINNGIASVTVIGDSGVLCDALSTALFVMGKEAAVEHWRKHCDFEMIIITDGGEITVTEGIQSNFSLSRPYEQNKLEVIYR